MYSRVADGSWPFDYEVEEWDFLKSQSLVHYDFSIQGFYPFYKKIILMS